MHKLNYVKIKTWRTQQNKSVTKYLQDTRNILGSIPSTAKIKTWTYMSSLGIKGHNQRSSKEWEVISLHILYLVGIQKQFPQPNNTQLGMMPYITNPSREATVGGSPWPVSCSQPVLHSRILSQKKSQKGLWDLRQFLKTQIFNKQMKY
jgi:hypothetical protein